MYIEIFSTKETLLDPSKPTVTHQDPLGPKKDSLRLTRTHQDPPGSTGTHQDPPEPTRLIKSN